MDESPKQLIAETRTTDKMKDGTKLIDFECSRKGACNIFIASGPLDGKRIVKITKQRTKKDWAVFIKEIADNYKQAKKITLVMDNLNTHTAGSFYGTFSPEIAKQIWDGFEFVFTPKHGSWLNMAEIELNVLNGQCLNRRIDNIDTVKQEVEAWQEYRNNRNAKINWRFTTDDSRIKLKRLYPSIDD